MGTNVQAALSLLAFALLFAPACLLTYVAIKARHVFGGAGGALVSIGAIFLTIASLDFLFNIFAALLFGAPGLARFSLISTYIFKAMNYLALLAIGFGMLASLRRLSARVVD